MQTRIHSFRLAALLSTAPAFAAFAQMLNNIYAHRIAAMSPSDR
jgi:hypothetical protein